MSPILVPGSGLLPVLGLQLQLDHLNALLRAVAETPADQRAFQAGEKSTKRVGAGAIHVPDRTSARPGPPGVGGR